MGKHKKSKAQLARIETSKKLRLWSQAVRNRDGHVCQVCGSTGLLNSHHMLDRQHYPEHKFDINCGILLCVRCHKWGKRSFHGTGMWACEWLRRNKPEAYAWVMGHIEKEFS